MLRRIRARRRDNDVDNGKLNSAFAKGVLDRDGRKCRMERLSHGAWVEHGIAGSAINPIDPAHIYPRGQIGKAKYDPIVGIAACRDCHEIYDGKRRDDVIVRVPIAREADAWHAISEPGIVKVLPFRRKPRVLAEEAS